MHIGFSGTRHGMTDKQKIELIAALRALCCSYYGPHVLHHGDCVGADKEAVLIARQMEYRTCAHPPIISRLRAFMSADYIHEPKEYLARNRDIVNASQIIITCPSINSRGTKHVINYARQKKKHVIVINQSEFG